MSKGSDDRPPRKVKALCECNKPLAYLLPGDTTDPRVTDPASRYVYAFSPESDWVADWTDAITELIPDAVNIGIPTLVREWHGRRKPEKNWWQVRCTTCRREYRGRTAQLAKLDADTRAAGRRSFTLSADALIVARAN